MSGKRYFREAQEAEFKRLYPKSVSEQIAERDAEIAERLARLEADPASAIPWKEVRREGGDDV